MSRSFEERGFAFTGASGRLLLGVVALAIFFMVAAASASPARADILKVTNKKDSGAGSLRAAIYNAAPRGDTITFAPNVRGTITLTSGTLDVDKNITIGGPGAGKLAVSGNNDDGVFYIYSGKTVRMSGLTITKGNAWYSGGGIDNRGNLTLIKSVVRDNYADASTGFGGGGGIDNSNVLTLIESTVSGNFSDNAGGGIYSSNATLTVQRSTISGNRAEYGGGIYSSTDRSGPEKTTIANSTISGNSISLSNGAGGGVYNDYGLTEIKNTTITNNTAPVGGPVYSYDDSSYANTRIFSTIIADNTGAFSSLESIFSQGYNLVSSGFVGSKFNKPGDRTGVGANHGLKPLADNGGPTKTHALQSGSPAINAGSPNCPSPTIDQRGAKRPYGGRCDIGSFEFGATPPSNDGGGGGGVPKPPPDKPNGCTITGTPGNDTLRGTPGRDVICGLGGNDVIRGLGGNDTIKGGPGNDRIYGGAGNDRLIAGPGKDQLYGQGGKDSLNTRDNKPGDFANGGPGGDRCISDKGDRKASCER